MFRWNKKLICLIWIAMIGCYEAESLQKQRNRVKRGLSGGGANNYGPPVLVSSGVLQLEHKPSAADQHSNTIYHQWKGSNLSPGYELWLNSESSGLENYQPIHTVQTSHSGGDHFGVFSTDQQGISGHISHTPTASLDGHLSGVLHTQVISSGGHDSAVSGKVDFNDVADIKSHFPVKSYGR